MTVMSPIYSTVTGLPLERALGDGWLEVVPDGRGARGGPAQVAGGGAERHAVPRGIHGQARRQRVPCMSPAPKRSPRATRTAAITAWFGTTEDITEEKRAEEARRDAEERLRESEELHRLTLELSQQIAWTRGEGRQRPRDERALRGADRLGGLRASPGIGPSGRPRSGPDPLHACDRDGHAAQRRMPASHEGRQLPPVPRARDAAPRRGWRDPALVRGHRRHSRLSGGRFRPPRRRGALSPRRPGDARCDLGP